MAVAIFFVDLLLPLGIAGGVPYVAIVLLGIWSQVRCFPYVMAAIATLLTFLGYFLSPLGADEAIVITNRGLAIFAIWITAVLLTAQKRLEHSLREREERLTAIMDNAADGIITINERGVIETFNYAAEVMFGYMADHARGQNISMLMPEPDHSQHDGYIANYLETEKGKIVGSGPRDVIAQRHGGETFPMSLAISVMDIDDEIKFIGVVRDITKQKDAELQMQRTQKMEVVGQLTSGIAHDFNNLLTVIMGNLQLAYRLVNEDRAIKRLDAIMGAAKNGSELIRRLLRFTRAQELDAVVLNVSELVGEMEDMLQRTMGEHVSVTTKLDSDSCFSLIDANQLEHALLNLSVNARDAMPEGGKLTIGTKRHRVTEGNSKVPTGLQPGDYVEIYVSDTGKGISPNIRERIFEPFFTTKAMDLGAGLGLNTAAGFIEQSGGLIDVVSEVGVGTTFRLFIPLTETIPPTPPRSRSAGGKVRTGDHRGTVLVVEDADAVREIAVSVLTDAGYDIIEANSGLTGLKAFNDNEDIDIVFSDVVMPGGMSGPEMMSKIRKTHPDIPVLFASGYTEQAQNKRVTSFEHSKFINKPYDVFDLPVHIASLLVSQDA
jgi:PAS domain S-box-containing protein